MAEFGLKIRYDYSELQEGLVKGADGLDKLSVKGKKFGDDASKAAQQAARNLQQTRTAVDGVERSFSNLIRNIGIGLGVREVLNFGKSLLQVAGDQEKLNTTMTTFLKSGELSKKMLLDLSKFALVSPFSKADVDGTAKSLLAFNFSGKEIIPTLKTIGDVSAGSGKNIRELGIIYGQVKLAGKLYAQELLQFTNAGVPVLAELAKNFGVAESDIRKMTEQGKIGFKDVENAFKTMTSEGGLFFNLMENQSKSFLGIQERVSEQFNTFKRQLGEELLPIAKEAYGALGDFFQSFDVERMKDFGRSIVTIITLFREYGPLLLKTALVYYTIVKASQFYNSTISTHIDLMKKQGVEIKNITKAQGAQLVTARLLTGAMNLLKGAMMAFIGTAILQGILYLVQNYQKLEDSITGVTVAQRSAINASQEIIKQYAQEKKETDALFSILKDSEKTIKQRTVALKELQDIYPEYTANLDVEKSTLTDIAAAQERVNKALFESVLARKTSQIQEEAFNKVIENTLRIKQLQGGDSVGLGEGLFDLGIGIGGRDKAIEAYKQQNEELITNAKKTVAELNAVSGILSNTALTNFGRGTRQTGSADAFLKNADEREKAYAASLKKMTNAELNMLTASKGILPKQRQLVLEEIESRKKLTTATLDNKKAVDEFAKAMDALQQRLLKARGANDADQETDPIKRLLKEEEYALKSLALEKETTMKKAKNAEQRAALTSIFKQLEYEIIRSFNEKILQAEGELSEQQLADRIKAIAKEKELLESYYNDRIAALKEQNADPELGLEARRRNDEAMLQAESTLAERLLDSIKKSHGEQSQEYKSARTDFVLKNAAYHKLVLDNQKAYIEESNQNRLDEIDRQLEYGEISNKQRKRLELEKNQILTDGYIAQLKIQLLAAAGDEEEVRRLNKLISDLGAQRGKLSKGGGSYAGISSLLVDIFGLDKESVDATLAGFQQLKDSIIEIINLGYQAEIDTLDRKISGREKDIASLQEQIEEEKRLKEEGFAYNLNGLNNKLRSEQALLKEDKRKKLELQKEQLKQEAIIQTAQQAGALATAVANIIQNSSKFGIAGVLSGAASIISMFAIWKNYKGQVRALTEESESLYTGGAIKDHLKVGVTGKSDHPSTGQKGHRIEGTNLRVGYEEFLVAGDPTKANTPFLRRFNAGEFNDIDLDKVLDRSYKGMNYKKHASEFRNVIVMKHEGDKKEQALMHQKAVDTAITREFTKQNKLMRELESRRPVVINYPDGSLDVIEYAPGSGAATTTKYLKHG